MFSRECKNVQNSNKIALNSLKMLEIVFRTIQNSTFSGGACPGKDHHRQLTGHPTLRPHLSKIPESAPEVSHSSNKFALPFSYILGPQMHCCQNQSFSFRCYHRFHSSPLLHSSYQHFWRFRLDYQKIVRKGVDS